MKRCDVFIRLIELSKREDFLVGYYPMTGTLQFSFDGSGLYYQTVRLQRDIDGCGYSLEYFTKDVHKKFKLKREEYLLLLNLFDV